MAWVSDDDDPERDFECGPYDGVIGEFYASLRVDGTAEGGPPTPAAFRRIYGVLHRALARSRSRVPRRTLEELRAPEKRA